MAAASTMTLMEQMMEEISAGAETMHLEQSMECLKEADKKIWRAYEHSHRSWFSYNKPYF